jgi:hypothetical protein
LTFPEVSLKFGKSDTGFLELSLALEQWSVTDCLAKLRLKPSRLSPGMAIPLKAISIAFSGGGLIFEGLRKFSLGRNGTFCQEFGGANPQRSARCNDRWNSF